MSTAQILSSPFGPIFPSDQDRVPRQFRRQFLTTPESAERILLKGELTRVWFPRWLTPVFWLFSRMGILVDQTGEHIPTTFEVGAYRRPDGLPVHTWKRTFRFPSVRYFNASLIYEPETGRIADLIGPYNSIHIFWLAQFHSPSGFTLDTSHCALAIGDHRLWLPRWLWPLVFGFAHFKQVAVPDSDSVKIDLRIDHPLFGEVFGYTGVFTVTVS